MVWAKNITGIDEGQFRTINGNADEMIGVGRCMKAGFPCSRVDITNGRYDAIVDVNTKRLLRIQIKGSNGKSFSFTGGTRSGQQINRQVASREYKYCPDDCDVILGVDGRNGDCYIIPISEIEKWGKSKSISQLSEYKENWGKLVEVANSLGSTIKT